MLSSIRNVKFIKMSKLNMFFSAVCVLFLNKIKGILRFKPIASSLAHCAQT